ncbi:hypothetical protein A3B02_00180 [Candidatus Roizmanbacteria bacterium RIFCSPLOWO2_01_FULL_42_14]|uniref:GDP-L-fucose synthase n=1 Tax=Candidatus Roizmanbacteria bacterium RIFCSPLOWO2_01_FULL_42_14 TaxID=1802068 RepID=A0A1F7J929_9BACT|nr:MAG: hypothetical protein A3B02_00180 [Candidatus Roizmanbacteria bacterium RIFCSPLOWO2_01_FULL_42_14]
MIQLETASRSPEILNLGDKRIVLTGGSGFIGSHVAEVLHARGVPDSHVLIPRSAEYDLRRYEDCVRAVNGADIVIHLAALARGLRFLRKHPAEVFDDNALMGINLLKAAREAGVEKYLTAGSIYVYPQDAAIPLVEDAIGSGPPNPGASAYGMAKLLLLSQIQAYAQQYDFRGLYIVLANIYGPRDNFSLKDGKVLPSLIRRIVEAQDMGTDHIDVWGTGRPTRDFLYVEDAAEGIVRAIEEYDQSDPVNLGAGVETPIKTLVEAVAQLLNFSGEIRWDTSKPDGAMRFCSDITRAQEKFHFRPQTSLDEGLRSIKKK